MPSTVPDGLPYEDLLDEPTGTLNGGSAGLTDILAIKTQAAITDVRTQATDIDDRLTTVEAFGEPSWVKIPGMSGSVSNVATFVISPIPTGVYRAVRLHLTGNNESTVDPIRIRFNSDSTVDLHRSGYRTYDADGTLQFFTNLFDGEFWEIATWGTALSCAAEVTIFDTHVSSSCAFRGWGSRVGGTLTTHQETTSWGRLNSPRLLDSLRVSGPSGANFSAVWWMEGSPV